MHLTPSLSVYTREQLNARDAQRLAEFIAFGPIVFQACRLLVEFGILEAVRDAEDGLTIEEAAEKTDVTVYAARVLLEAGLSCGVVLVDPETDRFQLSKTGWFLLNDPASKVNMAFNHYVNYRGFYQLEEALKEGRPAGLASLGDWETIYEGLSSLPADVQKAWFDFDHFYSDHSFAEALEIVFAFHPKQLLDVGGNTGRWALQCVQHDPDVRVTIADLPQQIGLMKEQTAGQTGADRIEGYGVNLLDPAAKLPGDVPFDIVWMSQFLDCFSEEQIESILRRTVDILRPEARLCIMETFWDRQRFEPASFCLTMTSLYFTAMANGNSKMYHSDDFLKIVDRAGLAVEAIHDGLGQGHTILVCRRKAIETKQKNMDINEIKEKIKGFLVDEMEIDPGKILPDARLKEDMGIDSLEVVDIIVLVEQEFGFKMKPEDFKELKTFDQFCQFIAQKIA